MVSPIIIITGGPIHLDFLKHTLNQYEHATLIGVDHGNEALMAINRLPHRAIGDMDSISQATKDWLKHHLVPMDQFPAKKDLTDTALALEVALTLNNPNVLLLGATGGRLDHFLANVALLEHYKDRLDIIILDDLCHMCLVGPCDNRVVQQEGYAYFSLLPVSECLEGVTYKEAVYPLTKATLRRGDSLGVSNTWQNKPVYLSIKNGYGLLVRSRDLN